MKQKSPQQLSEAARARFRPARLHECRATCIFRLRLLDMKAEIIRNATDTAEHLREMSIPSDPADRATLEEEYALELRTRERERKLLSKIEGALQRIEQETYGYCEETGEPIGIPRLLARPTATLTIDAQERRERSQKAFAD
jgi:DnaK suppressor protein